MRRLPRALVLFLAMLPVTAQMAAAQGTTAFTYQGLLKLNGKLATGNFDFVFTLYDGPDPVFDTQIGVESKPDEVVIDGIFTVELDYGPGMFNGDELWMETCVREAGTTQMTCLDPLHQLNPVPYATFAINSTELDGLDSTDFLRRTAGCDICIGHADNSGSAPDRQQCFDLSSDGRNNSNRLEFPNDVDENDRLWIWMECPP